MINLRAEREAEARRVHERERRDRAGLPSEQETMDVWLPFKVVGALLGLPIGAAICLKSYEVVVTVVNNWTKVADFYQSLPKGGSLP